MALCVGRCMGVDACAHVACPLAVLLDVGEVVLVDQLVLEVAPHGGRAGPQAPHGQAGGVFKGSRPTWGSAATCCRIAETSALVMVGKNASPGSGGYAWTYSHTMATTQKGCLSGRGLGCAPRCWEPRCSVFLVECCKASMEVGERPWGKATPLVAGSKMSSEGKG